MLILNLNMFTTYTCLQVIHVYNLFMFTTYTCLQAIHVYNLYILHLNVLKKRHKERV